jgi:prevent-host-death family protein
MIVNIHEAKTQLSRLIERVLLGEDVTIARAGTPVARLVPVSTSVRRRDPGHDEIRIADDFDAPLPEELARQFE